MRFQFPSKQPKGEPSSSELRFPAHTLVLLDRVSLRPVLSSSPPAPGPRLSATGRDRLGWPEPLSHPGVRACPPTQLGLQLISGEGYALPSRPMLSTGGCLGLAPRLADLPHAEPSQASQPSAACSGLAGRSTAKGVLARARLGHSFPRLPARVCWHRCGLHGNSSTQLRPKLLLGPAGEGRGPLPPSSLGRGPLAG